MKGAVEYFILMIVLMFGILFVFNFYGVYQQNHNAHAYRDKVANLIENYDGDIFLTNKALRNDDLCPRCTFTSHQEGPLVIIKVHYTLYLKVLGIEQEMMIKGLSYLP
ncbi:MAG TPA: hypothetical protein VJY11_03245 [Erysipelothrix sp.]|nr:hypothetical protein [Erysipelothrix sp.]